MANKCISGNHPRAYHIASLQLTIYDAPAQSTTVSLERF